jgi:hypothetical protein
MPKKKIACCKAVKLLNHKIKYFRETLKVLTGKLLVLLVQNLLALPWRWMEVEDSARPTENPSQNLADLARMPVSSTRPEVFPFENQSSTIAFR